MKFEGHDLVAQHTQCAAHNAAVRFTQCELCLHDWSSAYLVRHSQCI